MRLEATRVHIEYSVVCEYYLQIGHIGVVYVCSEIGRHIGLINFEVGSREVYGIFVVFAVVDSGASYYYLSSWLYGILCTVAGDSIKLLSYDIFG